MSIRNNWALWKDHFFAKSRVDIGTATGNEKIGKNIYNEQGTVNDFVKRYNWFHHVIKFKLFVPVLILVRKFFGKYLVTEVPDLPEYRNMHVFDTAFRESIEDFAFIYGRGGPNSLDKPKSDLQWRRDSKAVMWLNQMKEMYLSFLMNDSAYMEFHNILMFNITMEMQKVYPPTAKHVFFNSGNINDVKYYIAQAVLEKDRLKELNLREVNREGTISKTKP